MCTNRLRMTILLASKHRMASCCGNVTGRQSFDSQYRLAEETDNGKPEYETLQMMVHV